MIKNQVIFLKINRYFKKNKVSINEIQKYLKKKGFTISKKNNEKVENNLGSIPRVFLCSLIIISIFSITPLIINFTNENMNFSKVHENNSKNKLEELLDDTNKKVDNTLDPNSLFDDILAFDDQPTDAVRLSAATIEELFKSTNYSLDDVRRSKLVKPIALTLLPNEIKKIENTKKRRS